MKIIGIQSNKLQCAFISVLLKVFLKEKNKCCFYLVMEEAKGTWYFKNTQFKYGFSFSLVYEEN